MTAIHTAEASKQHKEAVQGTLGQGGGSWAVVSDKWPRKPNRGAEAVSCAGICGKNISGREKARGDTQMGRIGETIYTKKEKDIIRKNIQ